MLASSVSWSPPEGRCGRRCRRIASPTRRASSPRRETTMPRRVPGAVAHDGDAAADRDAVAVAQPARRHERSSDAGRPNIRPCCASASIQNWSAGCGRRSARRSRVPAPTSRPAWSMCACVSRICFSATPWRRIASRISARSPPGRRSPHPRLVAPDERAVLLEWGDGDGLVAQHGSAVGLCNVCRCGQARTRTSRRPGSRTGAIDQEVDHRALPGREVCSSDTPRRCRGRSTGTATRPRPARPKPGAPHQERGLRDDCLVPHRRGGAGIAAAGPHAWLHLRRPGPAARWTPLLAHRQQRVRDHRSPRRVRRLPGRDMDAAGIRATRTGSLDYASHCELRDERLGRPGALMRVEATGG